MRFFRRTDSSDDARWITGDTIRVLLLLGGDLTRMPPWFLRQDENKQNDQSEDHP